MIRAHSWSWVTRYQVAGSQTKRWPPIDGNPEELTEVCEKRLKRRDNSRNRLLFSKGLFREGKFSRAEDEAPEALARDTKSVPAHIMVAATIIRQGEDLQPAVKLMQHAMQLVRAMPDKEEKLQRFRECVL